MEITLQKKNSIADKFKEFINYSIPLKIIFSSLIAALSGTTYFAIISNYSIYYYSIENGFRLPSEGSPFITIAVSAITFIVLLTAGVLFASMYGFARFININNGKLQNFYKKMYKWANFNSYNSLKKYSLIFLVSGKKTISLKFIFTCSCIAVLCSVFFLTYIPGGPAPARLYFTIPTFMGIYPIFTSLPLIDNKYRVLTCSFLSLLYIILMPIMSMDIDIQSKFLAMIKYGGDTKVALHFDKDDIREYNLVFRSSQSLFVRTGTDKPVSEFPLTEVKSIDYLRSK